MNLIPIPGGIKDEETLKDDFLVQNMLLLEGYNRILDLAISRGYPEIEAMIRSILSAVRTL